MNIWLSYHRGDEKITIEWLKWCLELKTTGTHHLFLSPAKHIDDWTVVEGLARELFSNVTVVADYEGIDRWPAGPNSAIRRACIYFEYEQLGPFFFIEPDCIPLSAEAFDQWEEEYCKGGKPFMGRFVPAFADSSGGLVPEHCTGNMMCPQNSMAAAPRLTVASDVAFDVYAAREVLPKCHLTTLIQHVFNTMGNPPTFPDQASLSLLQPGAVFFHRCKDGSLIERLRERRNLGSRNGAQGEPVTTPAMGVHPTPGAKPKVYTYYAVVDSMCPEDQRWMIEKWRQGWSEHGWEPVVLGPMDVKTTPEEAAAFHSIPTINPKEYEMACWNRWLAMRDRGGLLTDYDLLPYGFTPSALPICDMLQLFDGYVPCAVSGTKEQYSNLCKLFLATAPLGVDHWSDMLALEKLRDHYCTGHECVEYGKPGWKTARLVHYAHGVCVGKPRSVIVELAESERTQRLPPLWVREVEEKAVASITGRFRACCEEMVKIMDGKAGRKLMCHTELRKAGIIGPAKKHSKKRKWLVGSK